MLVFRVCYCEDRIFFHFVQELFSYRSINFAYNRYFLSLATSETKLKLFVLGTNIGGMDFSHNFLARVCVYGTEIALKTSSCSDNCTLQ